MKLFWVLLFICFIGVLLSIGLEPSRGFSIIGWIVSIIFLTRMNIYYDKFIHMKNLFARNRDENSVFFAGLVGKLKEQKDELDELRNR